MLEPLRSSLLKLIEPYNYAGFSEAEFKWDGRDGQYKLMEVNLRPVLQESLFTAAGVNFSYLAYQDLILGIHPPSPAYQPGLYWSYLPMDLLDILRFGWRQESWSWRDYLTPYHGPWVSLVPFCESPRLYAIKTGLSLRKVLHERIWDRLGH
jgi:predicted ATP-grasp superfamily ATP-dependent carboligase